LGIGAVVVGVGGSGGKHGPRGRGRSCWLAQGQRFASCRVPVLASSSCEGSRSAAPARARLLVGVGWVGGDAHSLAVARGRLHTTQIGVGVLTGVGEELGHAGHSVL
jgi:hypothetical protein